MKIGRHEHHLLASLIATHTDISDEEASGLSGYAPATICNMRQQRAFQKMVDHYAGRTTPTPPPDTAARMQALGLATLEELQERLHEDPDSWTKHELLQMAELLLIKAQSLGPAKGGNRPNGTDGIRVAISFVPAEPVPELTGPVIDHAPIYKESSEPDGP